MFEQLDPIFTHLLAEQAAEAAQRPKATALDTPLRYSGAYGCARRWGYDAFDAQYSEPPTPAQVWQATIGTVVGEAVARAIQAVYPDAVAEEPSQIGTFVSGSADIYAPTSPVGQTVFEHKKKGSYAFNKALGYKRRYGKFELVGAEGYPGPAMVQAGMNALGIMEKYPERGPIENVVVGVVSDDIVTVKELRQVQVSDFNRFAQEWVIPMDEWYPETIREVTRMEEAAETIDLGYIPDRWARDDFGRDKRLDPFGDDWNCDYCPFRRLCVADGDGQVRVLDSQLTKREG